MGSSSSKPRKYEGPPLWRTMESWSDQRLVIRIQSRNEDRLILVNKLVLIMRPANWDENFDIWIMPTAAAADAYEDIRDVLNSPPAHVINLAKNEESVARHNPKGVNRWRQVAKILTMPVPWVGYRLPYGEHPHEHEKHIGWYYKGIFNKENKAWCNGRRMDSRVFVEDCVMTVWHRFQDSQRLVHFVRAATGEGWGYD